MTTQRQIQWNEGAGILKPHVLRIATPNGCGSGFFLSAHGDVDGIATALHVIDQAHDWKEPIRIDHVDSGSSIMVSHEERVVRVDRNADSAVIFVKKGSLSLPKSTLPLTPRGKMHYVGSDIGWLGFPSLPDIPEAELCFFAGKVSAWLRNRLAYLVDGVAIHGVSGAPAFRINASIGPVVIVGVVTAYFPNRTSEGPLPGVSFVQDVSSFHEFSETIQTIEEGKS